jgi:Transposase DDE domain group 1
LQRSLSSRSEATAMTDCNRQALSFSSLGSKALVADFQGGRLTSDAGALLLREVGEQTGLFRALDQVIPDPRDPALIVHDQQALLTQRIIALALGYEDLNDHLTLRTDPALQAAAAAVPDQATPLASPSTLCRLENRIDRPTLVRIAGALLDQFIASHPEPPEHLILDFDATDDPVHGHQEGRFFHGYYDHYCFLPLYVFCGDELVTAYLRPSKIDAAKHARALLKLLVRHLRRAWPDVKITIRADSGFCRWRMMRWCDSHGVGYVLGLARNVALERRAADAIAEVAAGAPTNLHVSTPRGGRRRAAAGTRSGRRASAARRAGGTLGGPRTRDGAGGGVIRLSRSSGCHSILPRLDAIKTIEFLVRSQPFQPFPPTQRVDLVVDPCGGGFTVAAACRNLARRCVSCDIDESAVIRGQDRLAGKEPGLVG